MSVLIEHFAGAFPLWLAPVQARIVTINEKVVGFGEEIYDALKFAGFRVEIDSRNESLGRKIREAELEKIPHIIVIGEKEAEANLVNLRRLHSNDQEQMSIEEYVKMATEQVKNKMV
jgi:threonyl-tRNA synthetase